MKKYMIQDLNLNKWVQRISKAQEIFYSILHKKEGQNFVKFKIRMDTIVYVLAVVPVAACFISLITVICLAYKINSEARVRATRCRD